MADPNPTPNPTPTPPAAPSPSALPAGPPPPSPSVPIGITSEQLKARLDETRESTAKAILKDLGFESLAEGQTALKALKELQEAQMTDQQKLAARLAELEPAAARAALLEQQLTEDVEEALAAIPEKVREVINKNATTTAEKRSLIRIMRDTGAIEALSATPPPAAPTPAGATTPANPAPVSTAPAPDAPRPAGQKSKWDEYQALVAAGNQTQADIFFSLNRPAIEQARPAEG